MRAGWKTVRASAVTVTLAAVGVAMTGSGSAATIQAPPSGTITTVAGGVGGPESARQVAVSVCASTSMCQLAFAAGQLYFPDSNEAVRAVSLATGRLTTPGGDGVPWYGVNGEPATAAQFGEPSGLAVDPAGDLLVGDLVRGQHRDRPSARLPDLGRRRPGRRFLRRQDDPRPPVPDRGNRLAGLVR